MTYSRGAKILVLVALAAVPFSVMWGQEIVPCEGPNCDFNKLIELAENIINFIILIAIPVAAGLFAYAGFLYITAAGDMGKVASAHKIFHNVAVGLIIPLAAWLIVNLIVGALFDENSGAGRFLPE